MKKKLQFLIFDWSGVVSNDMLPTFETYNLLFQHYKVPEITLNYFRENFQLPYSLFTEKHLPGIALPEIQENFRQLFKTVDSAPKAIPGVAPVLRELKKRGLILSVLSSHPYVSRETKLFFPDDDFFNPIFEDVANKVDMIDKLIQESGFSSEEILYIGDMTHDIEAGKHGNVLTAGVLTGYDSRAQLEKAGADIIIENLEGILRFL